MLRFMEDLFQAIEAEDKEMLLKLLKNGADVNCMAHKDGFTYQTPLHCAIRRQQKEIIELLLQYGANVNRRTFGYLWSPFNLAISGDIEIIHLLLKYNAKVNTDGENGIKPLHRATTFERVDVIKTLLQNGADINAEDNEGKTAVYRAALKGNEELIKLFIENGANVNPQKYPISPLHCAIRKQNEVMFKCLLEQGADINFQFKNNKTALNYAIEMNNIEYLCLLLEHEADVNVKSRVCESTNDEKLPLEYAYSLNYGKCRNVLLTHIFKLKSLNKYVNDKNLFYLDQEFNLIGTNFSTEVGKLKNEMMSTDYRISLYNILVDDLRKLSTYLRNKQIQRQIKTFDYYKIQFPLFCDLISYRINTAVDLANTLSEGEHLTRSILNAVYILPDLCVEKVCSFMNKSDISYLINSFKL